MKTRGIPQFLKDMFLTVNNRVNGYEHVLARTTKSFRMRGHRSRYQPHQGAQECARRKARMERGIKQ